MVRFMGGKLLGFGDYEQSMEPRPFAWCKTRGPNALIRG